MGFFKRLGLFLYALAAVFCLASLGLYVFRTPFTHTVAGFMEYDWYRMAVVVTIGITALGALACLLRALFAPRRRKELVVSRDGQDTVTVTTAAITSQASHIVERMDGLAADRVKVNVKRGDQVNLKVRVRPHNAVNVVEAGARLRNELSEGLTNICGDCLNGIELQFVESDRAESVEYIEQDEHVPAANVHVEMPGEESLETPAEVSAEVPAEVPAEQSSEVTIPMGSSHSSAAPAADDNAYVSWGETQEEGPVWGDEMLLGETDDKAEE